MTDTLANARTLVAPLDTPAARRMVVAADDLIARNITREERNQLFAAMRLSRPEI